MKLIKEEPFKLIAVLFTQKECDKTQQIMPKLEEFSQSEDFKNVIFVSVFLETETVLFKAARIQGTPTIVFYRKKEEVGRVIGAEEEKIEEALKELCPNEFTGTARKITPVQNQGFDYLDQIAHSKPSLLKDETGYKPKEKAKPVKAKAAVKIEEEEEEEEVDEAKEKEKIDALFDDLTLIVDDIDEDVIRKAIEYYGTSLDTEEMEELCRRAANDDWDASKKYIKKNKFTKGLTNEQISMAQELIDMSFNEADAYCVVKESSDIDECMSKLGDWQDSRVFIQELGDEAIETLDMLLPVFGFTRSFEYINDEDVQTKEAAKKIIREHKRAEKEKERAKNQVKKMIKQKPSGFGPTTPFELSEEEKQRELWERQEAIREAQRIKQENIERERMKAEIARKIKEQRKHNKIEEQMYISETKTAARCLDQPKIAAAAQPKPQGTKGKCKVILFHEKKSNAIVMSLGATVGELIEKWAAAAGTNKDCEYQLSDPVTNNVIECTRESTLSDLGINGVARFNISVKFSE